MSGYKHSGYETQAEWQAAHAFAAFMSIDPDSDACYRALEAMTEDEWARWLKVAEVVRDDTRGEPRW